MTKDTLKSPPKQLQPPKLPKKITLPLGHEVVVETTTHTLHRGKLSVVAGWLVIDGPNGRSFVPRGQVNVVTEANPVFAPPPLAPRVPSMIGRPRVRVTLASLITTKPPSPGEEMHAYVQRIGYKASRVWTTKDNQHLTTTLQRYGFRVAPKGDTTVIESVH